MQAPQDAVDAFGPDALHAAGSPAPAVLIVRVRRGRTLDALLPPALIAVAAGLVLAYRGAQSEWDGLRLPGFTAIAKAGPTLVKAKPVAPKIVPKIAAAPVTPPAVPKPSVVSETKLTDAAKAKVWDDIELEARKTREQQAELERVKADEDARAAAAPPPIDRKALKVRAAAQDIDAILKARMQMHQRIADQRIGARASMQRRQLQPVESTRRSWIDGGSLPNRMGGRPGVPFPPRPIPPRPPHEAFADLDAGAPQAEPQVRIEFRKLNGPGNVQGYVFRRQTIVNPGVVPPLPPRPIKAESNEAQVGFQGGGAIRRRNR